MEVAEADTAALPPAYPIGSAVLWAASPARCRRPSRTTQRSNLKPRCAAARSRASSASSPSRAQHLQVGDPLMVLEAMKMETNITAPIAGRIAALRVAQGDNVQSGQIVVEFEVK